MTEAEGFTNVVDSELGSDRLSRLQAYQDTILDSISVGLEGKEIDVYFEELRNDGYVAGRSGNNVMVKVKGSEEWLGKIAHVKITGISRSVQYGEIIA